MKTDPFKHLLTSHEALRRQLEPFEAAFKFAEENKRLLQMVEDRTREQAVLHAALGPMEDLRRIGLLDGSSGFSRQLQDLMKASEGRFRLPELAESTKLLHLFEDCVARSALKRFQDDSAGITQALEAMRAPWLDTADQLRSFGGFVDLQRIGGSLLAGGTFDAKVAKALRQELGDWREPVIWPPEIFNDSVARSTFYAARGLDSALTNFPALAFDQSITIAGLKSEPPELVESYYVSPDGAASDEQEVGFGRTNAAHDRLQRFESQLRQFIDREMQAHFGPKWIKTQVPEPIRDAWSKKKQAALADGGSQCALIAYADFTDYVPIILRKDNWNAVFARFFTRTSLVQESLQRIYPIRICTMHARVITQDDELYLYVETKRILDAIGRGRDRG